jgi:hypothetical protein
MLSNGFQNFLQPFETDHDIYSLLNSDSYESTTQAETSLQMPIYVYFAQPVKNGKVKVKLFLCLIN